MTPRSYVVAAQEIRRFCQATGFPEPAPDARGRLLAPPLFCQTYMFEEVPPGRLAADGSPAELQAPLPPCRTVGGSSDFEFLAPVYSGDTLSVVVAPCEVSQKAGRSGLLYLVSVRTTFLNQDGQTVARELATYVRRPIASQEGA